MLRWRQRQYPGCLIRDKDYTHWSVLYTSLSCARRGTFCGSKFGLQIWDGRESALSASVLIKPEAPANHAGQSIPNKCYFANTASAVCMGISSPNLCLHGSAIDELIGVDLQSRCPPSDTILVHPHGQGPRLDLSFGSVAASIHTPGKFVRESLTFTTSFTPRFDTILRTNRPVPFICRTVLALRMEE
jgi:hypothetical protein